MCGGGGFDVVLGRVMSLFLTTARMQLITGEATAHRPCTSVQAPTSPPYMPEAGTVHVHRAPFDKATWPRVSTAHRELSRTRHGVLAQTNEVQTTCHSGRPEKCNATVNTCPVHGTECIHNDATMSPGITMPCFTSRLEDEGSTLHALSSRSGTQCQR